MTRRRQRGEAGFKGLGFRDVQDLGFGAFRFRFEGFRVQGFGVCEGVGWVHSMILQDNGQNPSLRRQL